jgi:GABA(A) receptor-associated protein
MQYTMPNFKSQFTFEERCKMSAKSRERYPERVPIIVQKADRSDLPEIDKCKFLVPACFTMGQMIYTIRKRLQTIQPTPFTPDKALFVFVGSIMPTSSSLIRDIFKQCMDEDGLLYLTYAGESTFG